MLDETEDQSKKDQSVQDFSSLASVHTHDANRYGCHDLSGLLKIAADVSTKINTTLEIDAIFDTVIPLIIKGFDLYHVQIFLSDETSDHLYLRAGSGTASQKMIEAKYSIPSHHPHSLVAQAARTNKVVVINKVRELDDYLECPNLHETHSEAAFPMITGGHLIGIFDLQHVKEGYFTEENINIFLNLSGQIATAVQNARYVTEIKQSLIETQYQVTINERLASAKTVDDILDIIVEEAHSILPAQTYLLTEELTTTNPVLTVIRSKALPGVQDVKLFELGTHIPEKSYEMLQLVQDACPYIAYDVWTDNTIDPVTRTRLTEHRVRSFIIAPMKSQEAVSGYLIRLSAQPEYFNSAHLKMTTLLLERSAEALAKARLQEELKLTQFSVDQAPAAILWIRPDGTLYSVNDTACELLGYSRNELLALSRITLLDPNMIPKVWDAHWRKVLTDRRFTIETEYRSKLGKLIPVEVTTNYLRYGEQEFNCVFIKDITERRQAEKTREQFTLQLHTSAEISERVGAILDPDQLLNTVIPLLKEQFDLYHAHVYVLDHQHLVLRAGYGRPGQIMVQQGHKIPYHHPQSLVARAARTRQAVVVNDVSKAPDFMPNILLPKTQSEVAVPIIFRDQVLGVFDVQSDRLNNFTELDLDAYRILAGQLANALYSATLFEQQKNTAAELRKTAETIRGIFNAMTEGIMVTDMMGNIMDLNEAALHLFGYTQPDELLNRNITELVTRPSMTRLSENLRRALELETDAEIMEYAMINKDGDVFDAEQCFSLLRDTEGHATGIVSITRDITERKRIFRDIARFRALAENAVDAIVMADLSGHIDYANLACFDLFGYDKTNEDMVGKLLFSLWPENTMPLLLNEVLPSAGENGWQGEVLQVRKDKSTFDASLTCFSVKSDTGQPICIAAIIRDITARKKAEQDLQRFAVQMSTAAQVSTQVNTILDPNLLLEEVVPLVQKRFNLYHVHVYTFDESGENLVMRVGSGEPGRLMREQGHHIAVNRQHSLVAKAARTRETILVHDITKEVDFLPNALLPNTRSELAIPMIVVDQVVGVFDVQDDKVHRFSASEVDVISTLAAQTATSFRNARSFEAMQMAAERLREVDRLKSEFLSNMSHELRTPLNSILGYAEVILMGIDGDLPDMMKEDVEAIFDNGQQLLSLINDILDLTKIEAGQMTLNLQPVEIVPLLEGSKTNNMGLLLKRRVPVDIQISVEHDLPPIKADRIRLSQILNNLVSNAVKFTDEGTITISAKYDRASDCVFIEVKDTGPGISPQDLPKLFQRFKQVDGSSTRRVEGTGLGLAISKHLVELHGGVLSAESILTKGSTFTVSIPIFKP